MVYWRETIVQKADFRNARFYKRYRFLLKGCAKYIPCNDKCKNFQSLKEKTKLSYKKHSGENDIQPFSNLGNFMWRQKFARLKHS